MANETAYRRPTFRLLHLFLLTALICVCLAIYMQWGVYGVPVVAAVGGGAISWIAARYRLLKTVELLTLWVILCILAGLLLPAVQMPSPEGIARRRLRYQQEGFRDYQNDHGRMPAATFSQEPGPQLSWRVLIADYLEGAPIGLDRTKAWDHPSNVAATQQHAHHFRCPLDAKAGPTDASFVAITGPETCWPEQGLSADDIPDGEANTILVVDSHRTGIAWVEPRDLQASELDWQINAGPRSIRAEHGSFTQYLDGSKRPSGPRHTPVSMADGSTDVLSTNIDPIVLQQLVNRRDGRP